MDISNLTEQEIIDLGKKSKLERRINKTRIEIEARYKKLSKQYQKDIENYGENYGEDEDNNYYSIMKVDTKSYIGYASKVDSGNFTYEFYNFDLDAWFDELGVGQKVRIRLDVLEPDITDSMIADLIEGYVK